VIKDSFSQPGWFHGSKVECNTSDCDNRMGYTQPFIPPKITATCAMRNHTLIYFISLLTSIVVYHNLCSWNISTSESPPKTANVPCQGVQFGKEQYHEDNSESSDNSSRTATAKDSRFGKQTNPYHLQHGYG